jgi:2-keto-4-pentenoate hydratase
LLWGQHRGRVRFESIASLLAGQRAAEAYAVQDELVQLMIPSEGAPRGYKIGLTSLRMRQMCGLDEPVAGRILERRIYRSPARLPLRNFVRLGVESELCLIMKNGLPVRASPYGIEEIGRAIGAAAAAFELVDDRGADYTALDACSLIADNSWNAGVVLGESCALGDGSDIDVGALEGVLLVDGQRVDSGNSRDGLSHPFAVVQWLSEHLRSGGSYLRAGDLVMTGSIVPTRFANSGEHYRFELAGLAPAELWVS